MDTAIIESIVGKFDKNPETNEMRSSFLQVITERQGETGKEKKTTSGDDTFRFLTVVRFTLGPPARRGSENRKRFTRQRRNCFEMFRVAEHHGRRNNESRRSSWPLTGPLFSNVLFKKKRIVLLKP